MDTLADYEPLEYYTDTLRETVKQNAADYFDALVKRAGVSAKQNASLVSKYNAACAKAAHAQKKLNSCKVLRGFTIFFTVAAFFGRSAVSGHLFYGGGRLDLRPLRRAVRGAGRGAAGAPFDQAEKAAAAARSQVSEGGGRGGGVQGRLHGAAAPAATPCSPGICPARSLQRRRPSSN